MADLVTQPFRPRPTSPEDLLEVGLPNLWYLVAKSEEVTDRPVGLKRLNRNLALWRDGEGRLQVVEDYCPHRGAPLSMGQVIGDTIACPYHGFQLDGDGVIQAVPPTLECPLVGQKLIQRYEAREVGGAIWVYIADDDSVAAPEPVFPRPSCAASRPESSISARRGQGIWPSRSTRPSICPMSPPSAKA
jgi:phenylpropionate dioxygenase-like ring-hydroxylating dioxygenase large terminal subunit